LFPQHKAACADFSFDHFKISHDGLTTSIWPELKAYSSGCVVTGAYALHCSPISCFPAGVIEQNHTLHTLIFSFQSENSKRISKALQIV